MKLSAPIQSVSITGGVEMPPHPEYLRFFSKLVNAISPAVADSVSLSGASLSSNAAAATSFAFTLTQNATLENPTNLRDGQILRWKVKQDASGGRTLSFGSKFKFPSGTPAISATAGAVDLIVAHYFADDDVLLCSLLKNLS